MGRVRTASRFAALFAALASVAMAQPVAQPAGPPPAPLVAPAPARPAPPAPAPAVRPKPAVAVAAPAVAPAPLPGARLAIGQPMPQSELEAFVDGVVRQAMARDHIAGVTVSVVQDGQVVLKKGYGFASLSPLRRVDPDLSLFRIGSISKTFTWILAMKQVEAGRMTLTRPINLYLPEGLRVPDQGFARQVTLAHLMGHTPGFEDRALGQLFERDWRRERALQTWLKEERPHRVREPGTLVSYSNYGAALAGAAVAEVTGRPYEDLVESQITTPLGMTHTSFREPRPAKKGLPAPLRADLAAALAEGYRWSPQGLRLRPHEFLGHAAPAGAGSSTAADMGRYMLMLLGGGSLDGVTIYGPLSAQTFATPLPRPAPGVPASRHGFIEYPLPGGLTGYGHQGSTLSFLSNMVIAPQLNMGVFVSTNTDTGGPLAGELPARIVEHFYLPPPGPPARGSAALLDRRAAFEGIYLSDRRAYHGLEGFVDHFAGAETARVSADGRLMLAGLDGVQRWAPLGDPRSGQFVGEDGRSRLAFQMRDGRAVRYFAPWGAAAFDRVGFLQQTGSLLLLTLLTAVAAIATLWGLVLRARRDFRESTTQQRAGLLQTSQAVLWLLAMALFGVWLAGTGDIAAVMYGWPGFSMVLASTCALVATVLGLATLVFMPFVWRGGRRVDSWTVGRKARFTVTAVIFLGYAALLWSWGALEPWSG